MAFVFVCDERHGVLFAVVGLRVVRHNAWRLSLCVMRGMEYCLLWWACVLCGIMHGVCLCV